MSTDRMQSNVVAALRWAADDMRESSGRRWRWTQCAGERAYWVVRQEAVSPPPGIATGPGQWAVCVLSVITPRRDPELVCVALAEVARQANNAHISHSGWGYACTGFGLWGEAGIASYSGEVVIGVDVVYVHVMVAGEYPCPPEGGGQ